MKAPPEQPAPPPPPSRAASVLGGLVLALLALPCTCTLGMAESGRRVMPLPLAMGIGGALAGLLFALPQLQTVRARGALLAVSMGLGTLAGFLLGLLTD